MRVFLSLLALALALLPVPGSASAQVVHTPRGAVEFIGLERWTIQMIRDSMAVKAPGEPLGQCAAFLQQVGFPTTNSLHLRGEDGRPHVVVTVVEPHRADRLRSRGPFADSLPDRPEWREGIELFRTRNQAFQSAVQFAGVAATASQALSSLVRSSGRTVDWVPALASIRPLLAGTDHGASPEAWKRWADSLAGGSTGSR